MKQVTARLTFTALVLATTAAALAVACADSEVEPDPAADGAVATIPASDGGTDAGRDATSDADAKAPLATCTGDGWCTTALPDLHPWGLDAPRVTSIAMDPEGGAWATSSTFSAAEGQETSHLLHHEDGAWKPRFGVGFTTTSFPFRLNAITSNGSGAFIAVGAATSFGDGPRAVVLRITKAGAITVEYPADTPGLLAVAFAGSDEAWALDSDGLVYRNVPGDGGASPWRLVTVPHPAKLDPFERGPTAVFRSAASPGAVILAGAISPKFGPDGLIPGFGYVDMRAALPDGGSAWTSSIRPDDYGVQAGVESAPSRVWLAAQDRFVGSSPADGGALDASGDGGASGGLRWAQSDKLPLYASAIWARAADDVWAVGAVGRVYHYDGKAWSDAKLTLNGAPATVAGLNAIAGLPNGELWAGGQNIMLHRAAPDGGP